MALIPSLTDFTPGTTIASSQVDGNFTAIRTAFNDTALLTDVARTVTVSNTWSAVQLFADGTVTAPGVAFSADVDCGLYRIGTNNIGLAVNGAKVLDVATTGLGVTGAFTATTTIGGTVISASTAFRAPSGDATTPGYGFTSDITGCGLYLIGADNIGMTLGGTKRWDFGTGTSALTGALTVSSTINGQTISATASFTGTVDVVGNFSVATNKFTVTAASGNALAAGTLDATGSFAVNTNKFTVAAASGNTVVAGTLGVTGNLTVNTTALVVTASSSRVGIGLASSGASLEIASPGTSGTAFQMKANNGNTGFTISEPTNNDAAISFYGSGGGSAPCQIRQHRQYSSIGWGFTQIDGSTDICPLFVFKQNSGFTSSLFEWKNASLTVQGAMTTSGHLALKATNKFFLDGVTEAGDTYITESAANRMQLVAGGVVMLQLDTTAFLINCISAELKLQSASTRTTIGANGGATALTALPLGYIDVDLDGTNVQIPYYNRGA